MHIAHFHINKYIQHCKELGIETNNRALSKLSTEASIGLLQTTLDSAVTLGAKPPAFTTEGLMDHIIKLIVCEDEVGWITSDSAAVNCTTIQELKKHLTIEDLGWTAKEHGILCMEHALHLAAKHFVETIAPTTSTGIKLDHELAEINLNEPDTAEADPGSDNKNFSFHSGDSLGKALALVKQIRKSPQAHTFFKSMCAQVDIELLELLLWAVDQFILLADDNFKLTRKDWDCLNIMMKVLAEPAIMQQSFSEVKSPTVWRVIPSLEFLIECWESMAKKSDFYEVKVLLRQVLRTSINGIIMLMIPLLHILSVLIKDVYFHVQWNEEQYQEGMKQLEGVFDKYYRPPESINSLSNDSAKGNIIEQSSPKNSFQQVEKVLSNPRDELCRYLGVGPEKDVGDNLVRWWGHQSDTKYPTLKHIALDYLAIQDSATPSERAFSSGGIMDVALKVMVSDTRSHLIDYNWEQLNWVADNKVWKECKAAEQGALNIINNLDGSVLWFLEYSTNWIKNDVHFSLDAYIQMAL
ncbi:ribonuclease H-like domain-containing protein [Cyathus striatus]|nr:ribonuclease H-like domain-containing protein [Cyathus striatus]